MLHDPALRPGSAVHASGKSRTAPRTRRSERTMTGDQTIAASAALSPMAGSQRPVRRHQERRDVAEQSRTSSKPSTRIQTAYDASPNLQFERYKLRVCKERQAAGDSLPIEGEQILPFLAARERQAEQERLSGRGFPAAWHGKAKMSFDTEETVGELILDSQWVRDRATDRQRLRALKHQLKEEQALRRAYERQAAAVLHEEAGGHGHAPQPFCPASESMAIAVAPKAPRPRKQRNSTPPALLPTPIRAGGTLYSTRQCPRSLADLHPAAQAAVKFAARAAAAAQRGQGQQRCMSSSISLPRLTPSSCF